MSAKSILVSVFVFVLGAAAFAGEEYRMHIEMGVGEDGRESETFHFDNNDGTLSLHDMQVGESRTVTDETGATTFVVRTEEGFEFDIDGRKFRVGDIAAAHGSLKIHGERTGDFLVNVDQRTHVARNIKIADADRVTIITGSALDETTKQQIRDVLASTGHADDVTFIHSKSSHGDYDRMGRVHIITNELDVTN